MTSEYDLPQAVNIVRFVERTTSSLSSAIESIFSSGVFPLTKIRQTMSIISAVRMA